MRVLSVLILQRTRSRQLIYVWFARCSNISLTARLLTSLQICGIFSDTYFGGCSGSAKVVQSR